MVQSRRNGGKTRFFAPQLTPTGYWIDVRKMGREGTPQTFRLLYHERVQLLIAPPAEI